MRLACWIDGVCLTHKVGRIHDPIFNWMSAIKCEFQDLLLFLSTLLPDDLFFLVEEKNVWNECGHTAIRATFAVKAQLSPDFKTQAFAHNVLKTADYL